MTPLFSPLEFGALKAPNRIFMAPLTRCRADAEHVPTALMSEYYAQRASAGLLIAEATMAMAGHSSFWMEPGIYSPAQVVGWQRITDAVHATGGRIFLQIWHGGRACHPLLNHGAQPVAPSAIPITGDEVATPEGRQPYVTPRELRDDELPGIVSGFAAAAANALAAGFDGVEIHGANGYLLDEFLRDGANHRSGPYGGPVENRARLLFEVIEAVSGVCGSDRVGLRLSPLNSYNSMIDSDPIGLVTWLASRLNDFGLAYLHLMRGDFLQQCSRSYWYTRRNTAQYRQSRPHPAQSAQCANTGARLHLVQPLGFEYRLTEQRLRRAGMDYAELAAVHVHHRLGMPAARCWLELSPLGRRFALTTKGTRHPANAAFGRATCWSLAARRAGCRRKFSPSSRRPLPAPADAAGQSQHQPVECGRRHGL
jgi:N-ethylmaleimide reductase